MNLYLEAFLYSLQIIITFIYAGPKLAQAERQRTLSRNPPWLLLNPEFLRAHRAVSVIPFRAAALLSMILVAIGVFMESQKVLFAAHQPVFLVLILGLVLYCTKTEAKVLVGIPKDAIQRAPLVPRSAFRLLPLGGMSPLVAIFLGALALNGMGYFQKTVQLDRVLGNITFLVMIAGISLYGISQTIKRQPYRTTLETDNQGRTFELHLVLVATYFLCLMGLYFTVGSLGSKPIFSMPPTLLHALIESQPFPWEHYFRDFQYRIVDYSTTVFLIFLLVWTTTNKFYRKVLAVQFDKSAPIP